MTHYLLVGDDNYSQLDHVYASNISEARDYFFIQQRWTMGTILTLHEYQRELELNAYES